MKKLIIKKSRTKKYVNPKKQIDVTLKSNRHLKIEHSWGVCRPKIPYEREDVEASVLGLEIRNFGIQH
jgi:hypothetical protein